MMDKHPKFYEFNLVFLGKDCASFSTKKKNSSNGFKCTCSTLEWDWFQRCQGHVRFF